MRLATNVEQLLYDLLQEVKAIKNELQKMKQTEEVVQPVEVKPASKRKPK